MICRTPPSRPDSHGGRGHSHARERLRRSQEEAWRGRQGRRQVQSQDRALQAGRDGREGGRRRVLDVASYRHGTLSVPVHAVRADAHHDGAQQGPVGAPAGPRRGGPLCAQGRDTREVLRPVHQRQLVQGLLPLRLQLARAELRPLQPPDSRHSGPDAPWRDRHPGSGRHCRLQVEGRDLHDRAGQGRGPHRDGHGSERQHRLRWRSRNGDSDQRRHHLHLRERHRGEPDRGERALRVAGPGRVAQWQQDRTYEQEGPRSEGLVPRR